MAEEAVEHLGEAAANWHTLMPPKFPELRPTGVETDPMNHPETPPREPGNSSPGRSREETGGHRERLLAGMTSESNDFPSGNGEWRVSG